MQPIFSYARFVQTEREPGMIRYHQPVRGEQAEELATQLMKSRRVFDVKCSLEKTYSGRKPFWMERPWTRSNAISTLQVFRLNEFIGTRDGKMISNYPIIMNPNTSRVLEEMGTIVENTIDGHPVVIESTIYQAKSVDFVFPDGDCYLLHVGNENEATVQIRESIPLATYPDGWSYPKDGHDHVETEYHVVVKSTGFRFTNVIGKG
jgi:hypothetical protein